MFRKIFNFRDFMDNNIFCENHKSVHKIANCKYFAKVIIYSKSPDHVLKTICNMSIFQKFEIFSHMQQDIKFKLVDLFSS